MVPIVLIPNNTSTGCLGLYQWLEYCSYESKSEVDCVVEFCTGEFSKLDAGWTPTSSSPPSMIPSGFVEAISSVLAGVDDLLCESYHLASRL